MQTQEWADLKVAQGWQSYNVEGVFVLEKPLPIGQSFLYAPETSWEALSNFENFLENIKENIKKSGTLFLRLEILDKKNEEIIQKLKEKNFNKAFEELQPEWRQIIDITKSEDEILAQMKPKGRYNIKVAQKHGVEVTICPIDRLNDGIEIFYDLYQQTAQYQKISLRDKKYFLAMMKVLYPKGEAAIFIARFQNTPLAALLVTFYDQIASYLYGGTSRLHKEVMAPYAAHWQAILEAKKRGCEKYDLLAVAPPESPSHKYANLTFFKEQFGGEKTNITGNWDLVYKPTYYKMFKFVEGLRRR